MVLTPHRRKPIPIPVIFGFVTVPMRDSVLKRLNIQPAPSFRYNWIKYFSQYPMPKETVNCVKLPDPAHRLSGFTLIGEVVIEAVKLDSICSDIILNLHVSIFARDLYAIHTRRSRLRCASSYATQSPSPIDTPHTPDPPKSTPPGSFLCSTLSTSLAGDQMTIPVYVNHHEIRRLQALDSDLYPHIGSLRALPSIIVKVCNGYQTKVEIVNKMVPLKMPKIRTSFIKPTAFVPAPSARSKQSRLGGKERPIRRPHASPGLNEPEPPVEVYPSEFEKSTVDSLEGDTGTYQRRSYLSESEAFSSTHRVSEHTEMDLTRLGPQELDLILHPEIRHLITQGLSAHPEDIEQVFQYVKTEVFLLLEQSAIKGLEYFPHSRESVSIAQSIWRGIEETCCGGTLSPSSVDKEAREDIQQRMESGLIEDTTPLPSLTRQSRISHTHSHTLSQESGSTHGDRSTEESEMTTPSPYRLPPFPAETDKCVRVDQKESARGPSSLTTTFTHKEEELLQMHTREKVLRRASLELDTDEASNLLAFLESLKTQAVSSHLLPEVYHDWMVVIPKPACVKGLVQTELLRYRESLLNKIREEGSKNFILNEVKESLIRQLAKYIHVKFETAHHTRDPSSSQDFYVTLSEPNILASSVVDIDLIRHMGLSDTTSLECLHKFMETNLGLKFQANTIQGKDDGSTTLSSMWRSHLEQLSKFTWFTNETIITHPGHGKMSYKILRPQLFRSPHFSSTLIARNFLDEIWITAECSLRKSMNEQMTSILLNAVGCLESINDNNHSYIIDLIKEGASEWKILAQEFSILNTITAWEWELLFSDFLLEGILDTAIAHLRELA
eukprot:Blabericola_migrator_1__11260@NODE_662_length_6980_cov_203_907565_g483_i0_p1_GENE_NODE_662_length_6980_cov_203_907565_g483_i0NODE_662_length_6980_cov_203_907565_g483_i0_p1_ORF_typecomplete_len839_score151_44_NODE_662_length_6980_cov_203_907565_g483_i08663382